MENTNDSEIEVRFNMVAPKSWIDMIEANSKKKGINKSAYIRQLAIEDNERLNAKNV